VHHLDSWVKRHQLDVTCFIISLFNAQHISDVNTFILSSLRLICWVISWVVLLWFDVCWCYVLVWLWVVWYQYAEPDQYNPWNNSTNKSQAPEDWCINIRNMLSIKWWNNKASDIKLVSLYSIICHCLKTESLVAATNYVTSDDIWVVRFIETVVDNGNDKCPEERLPHFPSQILEE